MVLQIELWERNLSKAEKQSSVPRPPQQAMQHAWAPSPPSLVQGQHETLSPVCSTSAINRHQVEAANQPVSLQETTLVLHAEGR